MRGRLIPALAASCALSAPALAQEFDLAGYAQTELRAFPAGPQFDRQAGDRVGGSIALRPEFRYEAHDLRFTLIPFARWDSIERDDWGGRTHADLREANVYYQAADWDLTVGLGKVFWGRAESRNLVDIVNQTDLAEDVDGDEKLGQPMVQVNFLTDVGQFGAFVMPGFRDRTFPGGRNRYGLPLPVDADEPAFESGLGRAHPDVAFAYSHFVGAYDFRVSHFYGHGREPRLVAQAQPAGPALVPAYDLIHQTGLDAQATFGPWLWKIEGVHRRGQGDPFFALTTGVEYTLFGIAETRADLGLIAEHHHDGRDSRAPATPFDNDLFIGGRLAFNDAADSEIVAGAIVDLDDATTQASVEIETRLSERWAIAADGRAFLHVDEDNPLQAFKRDHVVQIRLNRYF